ncbi:hypothetical protein [Streptomyces sp. NPDC007100]|uniref:hypothetical protein n=1 Tax=Streptomyces sp. NPDC007100 TaxID=3155602 RepID=UPI0033F1D72A
MSTDSPAQAKEALALAAKLNIAVRRGSRWCVRYFASYAAVSCAFTFIVGMSGSGPAFAVATAAWVLFVAGISIWAARQQVHRKGFGRRQSIVIAAWGAVYVTAISVGTSQFPGNAAWWGPAALATAIPPAIGAIRENRA